jgi:non-specific serine/threonine protein kinase
MDLARSDAASDAPDGGRSLELAILPSGRVSVEWCPGPADHPAPAVAARIARAFDEGVGAGLLQLGGVELATPLTPSLAFGRDLAHLFMTRLCAVPDLAACWETIDLAVPEAELDRLVLARPPCTGAEHLDAERLAALWRELLSAARAAIARADGDVAGWLAALHPSWSLVGRICFHLAENKANEAAPFAFLATYAARVSQRAKIQHLPLGRALAEHAGDRAGLLALLSPVSKAAERSEWVRSLADSGRIFQPLAWTPREAYQLLKNVPAIEAGGIVVRVPDWWKPHQPPRPRVQVRLGEQAHGLGLDAVLDFSVDVTLDGEPLTDSERRELAASGHGLVRLKGRWVEIDREKLDAVLKHWRKVQRDAHGEGLSFAEGMRLLAGAAALGGEDKAPPEQTAEWSRVVSGAWLERMLDDLRGTPARADPRPELKAELRPYQAEGVRWLLWLYRLGLGGCLADDMGLGKTIQVLSLLLLLKRAGTEGPHLLVAPTTLLANWQAEATRFAPTLRLLVAHPSAMPARDLTALGAAQLAGVDLVVTSYGMVSRLPWLAAAGFSLVVLDEAQAIKNPGARQSRGVKAIRSRIRLALTGTPVENRLGDLWSIFDFACPGLLGSAAEFGRFARRLGENAHDGFAPLRRLVQPYMLRRLKSDKAVIADLPDKTEIRAWCPLTRAQAGLYLEAVTELEQRLRELTGIERRGLILAFLMRCKQICNHPSQWLGDGAFDPAASGKFGRLAELAETIAARQEKVLVFTQFREMTAPLADFLGRLFGRSGLVLHGGTPAKERKSLVDAFQDERGPPFFVLSLKAGGSGLNLTAASHVVHFDRWWNPAVEAQATDRAYRIGQRKNVLVHKFVCRGTVEEKIDALVDAKLDLSGKIVEGAETRLTEMSNEALLELVSLDLRSAVADG